MKTFVRVLWALLALVLLGLGYRLRRLGYALWLHLPRPRHEFHVERDIAITMPDGIRLIADHYAPLTAQPCPTIMIRTPYGRNWHAGHFGLRVEFVARRFAERGYHVLVQDTRGRFDSEGEFEPYFHEREDGLATVAWLRQQTWFNGILGMWGPSYLGIVQWTIADIPELRALFPIITASRLYDIVFPDGAFDLGLILRWIGLLHAGEKPRNRSLLWGWMVLLEGEWLARRAMRVLPITNADRQLVGRPLPYYRNWLEHTSPDDPLWGESLQGVPYETVNAPVHLMGGWYDFFLRGLLRDYAGLRAAGKTVYLTIGPWHHFSHIFLMWNTLYAAQTWFDQHLKGLNGAKQDLPVRLYVMGANEWRSYPDYPPPYQPCRYYLGAYHNLADVPHDAPPESYTYNPARPTPILGGAQFGLIAGRRDNRGLEGRYDVLTYTSEALAHPLEIIGPVQLELYVQSSRPYVDFFGRLCDVQPDGRSINICDGLLRVQPGIGECLEDGILKITVDMWATAHQFRAGHRLRLIISSGAHPRWNRHTGSANTLIDTTLHTSRQTVFRDTRHPSAVVLPMVAIHAPRG